MNIHEYQAKELFAEFGIPIPPGSAVQSVDKFKQAVDSVTTGKIVVKTQIHAGGRGKGTFTDGYKGGVKVCSSKEEALEAGKAMLGNTLVTHQTGPAGREVRTVYFTDACEIQKEYYLAILMDRGSSCPVIIASTEGGVDIETVAAETPEKIVKATIDPTLGLLPHTARKIAFGLGFTGDTFKQCVKLLGNLYRMFWECDCSMVEINPLITTPEGDVVALPRSRRASSSSARGSGSTGRARASGRSSSGAAPGSFTAARLSRGWPMPMPTRGSGP